MVISWEGSCGCISPETRVAVTHGDAQTLDRQCATNTVVRRNTDDNSWDASSIAQAMLNRCLKHNFFGGVLSSSARLRFTG
jgi:hypothetical protein